MRVRKRMLPIVVLLAFVITTMPLSAFADVAVDEAIQVQETEIVTYEAVEETPVKEETIVLVEASEPQEATYVAESVEEPTEYLSESVEEAAVENMEEYAEEMSADYTEEQEKETAEDNTEEQVEETTAENSEEQVEETTAENPEEQVEETTAENPEEQVEETAVENPEEQVEETAVENPEALIEENPADGIVENQVETLESAAKGISPMRLSNYDARDIEVGRAIIANNLTNTIGIDPDDPSTWTFAIWMQRDGLLFRMVRISTDGGSMTGDLDVSNMSGLESLFLSDSGGTNIGAINASGSTALGSIHARNVNLQSLNVQNCSSLSWLAVTDNNLQDLDLSTATALTSLEVTRNNLRTLDLSKCTKLATLSAGANSLSTLDLSNNQNLVSIYFNANPISTFITPEGHKVTVTPTDSVISYLGSWKYPLTGYATYNPESKTYTLRSDNSDGKIFEKWLLSPTLADDAVKYTGPLFAANITFIADQDIVVTPVYRYAVITEPENYVSGGSGVSAVVRGEMTYYQSVSINGIDVTPYVTVNAASNNLVINLPGQYLSTLGSGTHTLRVQYTDGYAETTVTVNASEAPIVTPGPTTNRPGTGATNQLTTNKTISKPISKIKGTTASTTDTSTKPATTNTSTASAGAKTAANTGDENNMHIWFILCAVSLVVIMKNTFSLKKRHCIAKD